MAKEFTTPKVGDGITMHAGSDSYPYTITEVSASGKNITVQRDSARRTDSNGYGGDQVWEITPDPQGRVETLSMRKDGYYRNVGTSMEWWNRWTLGRRRYSDPHF